MLLTKEQRSRGIRRARGALLALALLAAVLWPLVAPGSPACAAGGPHAALVVDTGAKDYRYCVALDAPRVSGSHVIELAHDQLGLDYAFGFGGRAVCRLAGVGSTTGCLEPGEPFWAYWQGDDSGGWTTSSSGAADSAVGDGDVEGWSWGGGDTPAAHGAPPPTTFEAVCGSSTTPTPSPTPSPSHSPTPSPSPSPDASPGGGGPTPGGGDSQRGREASSGEPSPAASGPGSERPRVSGSGDEGVSSAGGRGSQKREGARDEEGDTSPSSEAQRQRTAPRESATAAPGAAAHRRATPEGRGGGVEPSTAPAAAESGSGPPPAGLGALLGALVIAGAGAAIARRRRGAADR